jgi:molybdenum cofactor biosynthesis enzyme MoaA
MPGNNLMKPIAIRSLQCQDHAMNIPPTVRSVSWFLGKRCNYDCSYCSFHSHDAVSPFVDQTRGLQLIQSLQNQSYNDNKKIKWTITGGEPCIDPSLPTLVKAIHSSTTTEQINITTNGSLPFDYYDQILDYFAGVTVSLHLERSEQEIEKTVRVIQQMKNSDKSFISVNIMLLPGKLQQIKEITQIFDQSNISYVVRRITPPHEGDDFIPWVKTVSKKKHRELLDIEHQTLNKQKWLKLNDTTKIKRHSQYYSTIELEYMLTHNKQVKWNNAGVWDSNGYKEINTDLLVAADTNKFKGWTCWAGVDSLSIDFDMQIYRGRCQVGGALINKPVEFVDQPIICSNQWCQCNEDICVRKCQGPAELNLVS